MSNLKVNTINDASGGSAAVLYGVASPPNSMGFRNRIINGGMVIDQRNNGASVTATVTGAGTYTIDRWAYWASQASKFSVQRNAGSVTTPAGFTNYLGATSLASTSVGASDYYHLVQNIEGFNVADLNWGTASAQSVTLSFVVRSSLTGTFGGSLRNSAANRSYPFTFTINSASTWETKTVTIAGDTSGIWLTDSGLGITLTFGLGMGSTFSGAAGSWDSANYASATGATSVVGTNGATFYITGVQLEAGTVASPFERRDYGRELMMCQRYLQITYGGFGGPAVNGSNGSAPIAFAVPPRATPTVTWIAAVFTNNFPSTAPAIATITTYGFRALRTAVATGQDSSFMDTYYVSAEL